MKCIILTFLMLSFSVFSNDVKEIKVKTLESPDYYSWLTALSFGPRKWVDLTLEELDRMDSKGIAGRNYRVAVATSEIYSTVYIEEITIGSEGCCVRLNSIRELDMYHLQDSFNLKGEIAGFKVIEWKSFNEFIFSIHNKQFHAKIPKKGYILIYRVSS